MNKVYLNTGSNDGDRLSNLSNAREFIGQRIGNLISISHIYETEPWGYKSNKTFFNQCLFLETTLEPENVLMEIIGIEREMGRIRSGKSYADRIIDIDILFYNSVIINTVELTIPHPRLHERKFVLVPLAEIAKDFIHPVFMESIAQILESCMDNHRVIDLNLI